jgi:hypothetical protein
MYPYFLIDSIFGAKSDLEIGLVCVSIIYIR